MTDEINWKQEVQDAVCGIEDVSQNSATLTFRISDLAGMLGLEEHIIEVSRDLIVKAPSPVSLRLVDGTRYRIGDFVCQIAYTRMKSAHAMQGTDPDIIVNGERMTLEEVRPFRASDNWGISLGEDTLTTCGETWTIAGVRGELWLDGEPARFELTLRK